MPNRFSMPAAIPAAIVCRRIVALSLMAAFGGCLGGARHDPLVAQDLSDYTKKIVEWEGVEGRVLRAIASVERNQFVDDDYVAATLQAVMPEVRLHTEQAARYKPRTRAVQEIHSQYLQAWQDIANSFETIIHSMESHDYVRLSQGVEGMRHSRQELIYVAAALSELLDTSGVKPPPSRRQEKVKFRKGSHPASALKSQALSAAQPAPGGASSASSSSPH